MWRGLIYYSGNTPIDGEDVISQLPLSVAPFLNNQSEENWAIISLVRTTCLPHVLAVSRKSWCRVRENMEDGLIYIIVMDSSRTRFGRIWWETYAW